MIRTIALHGVFVTLSIFAARLGTVEAASVGLILVLLATAAYALDGFAYAAEIEAGQALGGRHFNRFIDSLKGGDLIWIISRDNRIGVYNFPVTNFSTLTDFNAVIEPSHRSDGLVCRDCTSLMLVLLARWRIYWPDQDARHVSYDVFLRGLWLGRRCMDFWINESR